MAENLDRGEIMEMLKTDPALDDVIDAVEAVELAKDIVAAKERRLIDIVAKRIHLLLTEQYDDYKKRYPLDKSSMDQWLRTQVYNPMGARPQWCFRNSLITRLIAVVSTTVDPEYSVYHLLNKLVALLREDGVQSAWLSR